MHALSTFNLPKPPVNINTSSSEYALTSFYNGDKFIQVKWVSR